MRSAQDCVAWFHSMIRSPGDACNWPRELDPGSSLLFASPEERAFLVERVIAARRRLTGAVELVDWVAEYSKGHLLAFRPDLSLSDGAARDNSGHFFDADNTPAWSSWMAFVPDPRGGALLCWIPAHLYRDVARAVSANPENCLIWATTAEFDPLRVMARSFAMGQTAEAVRRIVARVAALLTK